MEENQSFVEFEQHAHCAIIEHNLYYKIPIKTTTILLINVDNNQKFTLNDSTHGRS